MLEFGTRRSYQRSGYAKKVANPLLPEIEFLVMLAYQKFDNYLSVGRSRRSKIVAQLIIVHFVFIRVYYTVASRRKSTTFDNFDGNSRSTNLKILLPHRARKIMAQE